MRILRLYAPSLIGDHTLCYVHSNAKGESCVNEVPIKLRFAAAGAAIDACVASDAMTIVLEPGAAMRDGCFLFTGDALLCWNGETKCFDIQRAGFLSVSAKAEIWRPIKTAVLTISDKGSRGEREDTAGPELARLASNLGCVIEDKRIVPDEPEEITAAVKKWSCEGYNLVLSTGGTGLSPRDATPEALLSIADKIVPGFGEMMRMKTLVHTPRAFLTRSVAVVVGRTLAIAFPGSRRGASQCFDAISEGLRHGVETLAGWEGECGGH